MPKRREIVTLKCRRLFETGVEEGVGCEGRGLGRSRRGGRHGSTWNMRLRRSRAKLPKVTQKGWKYGGFCIVLLEGRCLQRLRPTGPKRDSTAIDDNRARELRAGPSQVRSIIFPIFALLCIRFELGRDKRVPTRRSGRAKFHLGLVMALRCDKAGLLRTTRLVFGCGCAALRAFALLGASPKPPLGSIAFL